jgi:3-methyladenine DNA glycosylase AlkD
MLERLTWMDKQRSGVNLFPAEMYKQTRSTMDSVATAAGLGAALRACASEGHAVAVRRFFKTGPGEYGEGDEFLGVRVPDIRRIARSGRTLPLAGVVSLLRSALHEERLLALLVLVDRYRRGTPEIREEIYRLYLEHTRYINNWDLVDTSAEHITGAHLFARSRRPLHRLARSSCIWERRIAIMSTFYFIKHGDFDETLALAGALLHDPEDLLHKAVGWMLREVGNRDRAAEERFLQQHAAVMPRTMLRYAIEKFPPPLRRAYLDGSAGGCR